MTHPLICIRQNSDLEGSHFLADYFLGDYLILLNLKFY
jgi:hypothetical protein